MGKRHHGGGADTAAEVEQRPAGLADCGAQQDGIEPRPKALGRLSNV